LRALAIEPRIDVAPPESPLTPHANRRDFARLNEPVHCTEIDLEIREHLFGSEEHFVGREIQGQTVTF
jgi:hypothetical protein